MIQRRTSGFAWDPRKERGNVQKHGVDFRTASLAFQDPRRKVFTDSKHSQAEERYFCIGKVAGRILTVRFVYREGVIRIIGAGYWRKGACYYEEEQ